ncbi:MAG: hypothetical protein K9J06_06835 [Flavobacteriales bacterium]|nr:hypothetical protein [Flavobacteriales bacterium]
MRTIVICIFMVALMLSDTDGHAQNKAWTKDGKVLSLGFGLSRFYHIDERFGPGAPRPGRVHLPSSGQFNFLMEFGIHQYVGLGFTTGIGGRAALPFGYLGEVNFPIGMVTNFHFYQLIADRTEKNIHAEQLDIYAGLSLGSGFALAYYNNEDVRVVPMAWGGPHAGIRWYFAPRVALNAEVGFGKSIVNAGFSFKL